MIKSLFCLKHRRAGTLGLSLFITSCFLFPSPVFSQPDRDNDNFSIPEPKEDVAGDYIWSDGAYYMGFYQMEKPLRISWLLEKFRFIHRKEADNVTAMDEVLDSSWFTNRHGTGNSMTLDELKNGPDTGEKPGGKWTVIKGKGLGINPGFVVRDEQGQILFVKFDPPKYPALGTNADVIASRFLYAAGYNVPEYHMILVDPGNLTLSPKATIRGKYKVKRPMTQADLDGIIAKAPKDEEGRLLANASKGLPGIPKGPFSYLGRRRDDPNDTVRHENRRDLRGLRVIMSWINNTDARRGNSLDVYVEEDGRKYIKHYLIDLSASFGSGNIHPKQEQESHEYRFDPGIVGLSIISVGAWLKPWERGREVQYNEVGHIRADIFEPDNWRGSFANPAFEKMTHRDAFWGAKIVTAFSDEDIAAIVSRGYYLTPGADEFLTRILIERRDKIGRHWFDVKRINPLDEFYVETLSDGGGELRFHDLALDRGYADKNTTTYRYRIDSGPATVTEETLIPLNNSPSRIKIWTSRDNGKSFGKPLRIRLDSGSQITKISR